MLKSQKVGTQRGCKAHVTEGIGGGLFDLFRIPDDNQSNFNSTEWVPRSAKIADMWQTRPTVNGSPVAEVREIDANH
jgi:gamma-glutamyltranspeptidase